MRLVEKLKFRQHELAERFHQLANRPKPLNDFAIGTLFAYTCDRHAVDRLPIQPVFGLVEKPIPCASRKRMPVVNYAFILETPASDSFCHVIFEAEIYRNAACFVNGLRKKIVFNGTLRRENRLYTLRLTECCDSASARPIFGNGFAIKQQKGRTTERSQIIHPRLRAVAA